MELFLFNGRAVCPICSGLVLSDNNSYHCFDCKTHFEFKDSSQYSDKAIKVMVRPKSARCEHGTS